MTHFLETLFYRPKWYHWIVAMLLLPISIIYGIGMWIRRKTTAPKRYSVPIVSVGNLVIGGSGKTPMVIAIAERFADKKVAIVSRGYGRQSRGLVEVSRSGEILCSVEESGDEAMLMALSLPQASVIVSEERSQAIGLAIQSSAEMIIMDDGFNRVEIEKFEVVLEPEKVPSRLPLPAGPMREFIGSYKYADMLLKEGVDYFREVSFENLTDRMVLVTAIADPKRLDIYLPEGVMQKVYLEDHAYFDKAKLENILNKSKAQSLLVTEKDWVKIRDFDLPISIMKLKLRLNNSIISQIESFVDDYKDMN